MRSVAERIFYFKQSLILACKSLNFKHDSFVYYYREKHLSPNVLNNYTFVS